METLKIGRPSVLDDGFTLQQMKDAYKEKGTLKEAAKELGISKKTLAKYLKEEGVEIQRGLKKGTKIKVHHFSCLAKWLREHKGERLPANVAKISRITGCSKSSVASYLYRRRKLIEEEANKIINDLYSKGVIVYDFYERKISLKGVSTWKVYVDRFTSRVTVIFRLKAPGKVCFLFDIGSLRKQHKEVSK